MNPPLIIFVFFGLGDFDFDLFLMVLSLDNFSMIKLLFCLRIFL